MIHNRSGYVYINICGCSMSIDSCYLIVVVVAPSGLRWKWIRNDRQLIYCRTLSSKQPKIACFLVRACVNAAYDHLLICVYIRKYIDALSVWFLFYILHPDSIYWRLVCFLFFFLRSRNCTVLRSGLICGLRFPNFYHFSLWMWSTWYIRTLLLFTQESKCIYRIHWLIIMWCDLSVDLLFSLVPWFVDFRSTLNLSFSFSGLCFAFRIKIRCLNDNWPSNTCLCHIHLKSEMNCDEEGIVISYTNLHIIA